MKDLKDVSSATEVSRSPKVPTAPEHHTNKTGDGRKGGIQKGEPAAATRLAARKTHSQDFSMRFTRVWEPTGQSY